MDGSSGTYGTAFRSNYSPADATNPSADRYKTNVNRSKTRKWVEAKQQTYDGDDWGADYDEDDDDDDDAEPVAMPTAAAARQAHQETLERAAQAPARPLGPRQPWSGPSTAPPPNSNDLPLFRGGGSGQPQPMPPLHLDTEEALLPAPAAVFAPHQQKLRSASASPGIPSPGSNLFPPRQSSLGQQDGHDAAESSRPASLASALSARNMSPARQGQQAPAKPVQETSRTRMAGLAPVAERMSEYGMDGLLASYQDGHEHEVQRMATSPQLPSLSRMSAFGDDFLSASSSHPGAEHMLPDNMPTTLHDHDQEQGRIQTPATPAAAARPATSRLPRLATDAPQPSPHDLSTPGSASQSGQVQNLVRAINSRSPSPAKAAAREEDSPARAESTAAHDFEEGSRGSLSTTAHASDIMPTAPLNPRKVADPSAAPPDGRCTPPPVERRSTCESATSSPVKESDMLREEIMQSLSPGQPPPPPPMPIPVPMPVPMPVQASSTRSADEPVTRESESSYLSSLYDEYWSTGQGKSGVGSDGGLEDARQRGAGAGPGAAVAAVAPEQPFDPERTPKAAQAAPLPHASNARRFSWETGPEQVNLDAGPSGSAEGSGGDATSGRPGSASAAPGEKVLVPPLLEEEEKELADLAPSTSQDVGAEARGAEGAFSSSTSETIAQQPDMTTILSFRQILDMASPAERIAAFRSTRAQFSTLDTGLHGWLRGMCRASYGGGEHVGLTGSFGGGLVGSRSGAPGRGRQSGGSREMLGAAAAAAAAAGQPEGGGEGTEASDLGSVGGGGGSLGLGHMGHTGQQVGAKGKELFKSAGKAGKGLLSKGRNKLRGTGLTL
ncbi:hypothetical protein P8C59_009229 [Phyllachora maydis]|uniref:Uncharacterized protein n=1 Tax=Phyllachora maydis TaxID=1825666 RepID=A0AAD9ICQ7_9PEZI|nr:hypothetical protein P8C59_009229 [Phyllachora maydis]